MNREGIVSDKLIQLANLIKERNTIAQSITALIGRPAQIGHIGEYIASKIFRIDLAQSATQKAIDGYFRDGLLQKKSVNVKWYGKREGTLDITSDTLPDYYLVFTGAKSSAMISHGEVRPWIIEQVFLFEAEPLVTALRHNGLKIGIATSVRRHFWDEAEIYPTAANPLYQLSDEQRKALTLFG